MNKYFVKAFNFTTLSSYVLLAFSLSACGGSSNNSNTGSDSNTVSNAKVEIKNNSFVSAEPITVITDDSVVRIEAKYGRVVEDNSDVSIVNLIDNESITENSNSIKWKYTFDEQFLDNRELEYPFEETLTIFDKNGLSKTQEFKLIDVDPYFKHQWYLYNTGNDYYEYTLDNPQKGMDHKILEAWRTNVGEDVNNPKYLSGKGVNVLVLDTAVDFTHPDLKDRVAKLPKDNSHPAFRSVNKEVEDECILSGKCEPHGSAVAGIIASSKNNQGTVGIAYNSNLISFERKLIDSLKKVHEFFDVYNGNIDVINGSFGTDTFTSIWYQEQYDIIKKIKEKEYKTVFVKSSGNFFKNNPIEEVMSLYSSNKEAITDTSSSCVEKNIECYAGFVEPLDRDSSTILVGALDANGIKAPYSSTSTSIWVSAFSGYGEKMPEMTTTSYNRKCDFYKNNFDKLNSINLFNAYGKGGFLNVTDDNSEDIKDCTYTSNMDGTSGAAPVVSGIVSLLKEYNPSFTVHQIKYILANSASIENFDVKAKIDVYDDNGQKVSVGGNWVKNSAGLYFNNWYGFGIADAKKAIELALNCEQDESCEVRKNAPIQLSLDLEWKACHLVPSYNDTFTYECTIDMVEELSNSGITSFETESVELNINALDFLSASDDFSYDTSKVKDFCKLDSVDQKTRPKEFYKMFANYSVEVISPNDTRSVVKPYYAMYMPPINNSKLGQRVNNVVTDMSVYLNMNNFYTEYYSKYSREWKVLINSECQIHLDNLSENLKLNISGYKMK